MATVNGVPSIEFATHLDTASNLGKRKRPVDETDGQLHGRILQNQSASLQNSLRSALEYLRRSVGLASTLYYRPLLTQDQLRPFSFPSQASFAAEVFR